MAEKHYIELTPFDLLVRAPYGLRYDNGWKYDSEIRGGNMGKEKDVKVEKLFVALLVTKDRGTDSGLRVAASHLEPTKEAALDKAIKNREYQFGKNTTDAFILVSEITEMTEPPKPLTETLIPFKYPE